MDRRHRDYYAIVFDERGITWKCYLTEDFRRHFTIRSQLANYGKHIIKVRWYSVKHKPYALISIPKRFTSGVLAELANVIGVYKIVPWTANAEKEYANQLGFIRHFTDKVQRDEAIMKLHDCCRKRHEDFAERIVTGDVEITWK